MTLNEVYQNFNSCSLFIQELKKQLLELVEANSTFAYVTVDSNASLNEAASCRYDGGAFKWSNGNKKVSAGPECSGCLFGQALQKMGWNDPSEMMSSMDIKRLFDRYINKPFCTSHLEEIKMIQRRQDNGTKWGELLSDIQAIQV